MPHLLRTSLFCAMIALFVLAARPAVASPESALQHVVSVLPVWPGHGQGGQGGAPGTAPEGSGIVVRPGLIVTAFHVVEPAERIDVRLPDGRVLPAQFVAGDDASDIALLAVEAELAPIEIAPEPALAQPVCAIGNAFGLGLSITCGVVSATGVTNAGFNAVEDFIQTDAAANPGTSGGALVDREGRLIGMVSAIFASRADTNIGVNFAVSNELLFRVADALNEDGEVTYLKPGWQLGFADRTQLAEVAAPVVRSVSSGGAANAAGVLAGDLILEIGGRQTRSPRDAMTALALFEDDTDNVEVVLNRNGEKKTVSLHFRAPDPAPLASGPETGDPGCPHPIAVCLQRQAVFPISSFDPVASATRIADTLLVTNRHVVGDRLDATVHTPDGPKAAKVVPSAFSGDLVLLEAEGLPDKGQVLELANTLQPAEPFYTIGADIARREVRVFDPGDLIMPPAEGAELGRLHVGAKMQPGVSGGALVDQNGKLTGIAVGGGDGRFEAIPVSAVQSLLQLRSDPEAVRTTRRLGINFAACAASVDAVTTGERQPENLKMLEKTCNASSNHGQLLEAGRLLAQAGDFEAAAGLHKRASEQVPNSINSRMSLLVSLQLGARFEDMTKHAHWLVEAAPDDPQALRFSIQSGVWGGDLQLAEKGYQALLKADPRQAQAARRFIDNAPPAPQPR
ncbi:trypsin-like peptidase domain-containing protein [Roseibium sp. HPY-6]|uniref:trypsin-like peptidase domain-containing protein n=1 Tax=Roseibium sp. HPY-6 TaxID=3229852 RepID=UPI00338FC232